MAPRNRSSKTASWRSHSNFVLLVVGFAIFSDMFLFACITPVLPFILHSRVHIKKDATQSVISASLAAFYITSILTPGLVAFFGRRQALRRPLYMLSLICLAVATILLYFARSLAVFIVSRILQGASGSIVWVIGMGMICDAVGIDSLGQATGTVFGLAMVGAMIAPAVGGALYRYSGLEGILFVSLAILIVDLVLRALVLDPDQASPTTQDPADAEETICNDDAHLSSVNERTPLNPRATASAQQPAYRAEPGGVYTEETIKSFRTRLISNVPILRTLAHPAMWTSIALVFFQAVSLSFIDAAIPLRLQQTLDFDSFKAGLMLLTITGMTVVVAPVAGHLTDRYQPRYLAVGGLIIATLGLVLLGLPLPDTQAARITAYSIYLSVFGLGLACLDSPAFVASAKLVDDLFQRDPRAFDGVPPSVEHQALLYTFFSSGMVLGPLVTAGLINVMSFGNAAFVLGGVALVLSSVAFLYLRTKSARDTDQGLGDF